MFDLLLRVFPSKRKKIATQQGGTRTFRILISLPYRYTTYNTDALTFRNVSVHYTTAWEISAICLAQSSGVSA